MEHGPRPDLSMATRYPDFVDLIEPFCESAKPSLHNQVFLEGAKSTLLAARSDSSIGGLPVKSARMKLSIKVPMESGRQIGGKRGLKALGRV